MYGVASVVVVCKTAVGRCTYVWCCLSGGGMYVVAVTTLSLPVGLRWGLLRCVRYDAVGGTGGVCMYVASVAILGCVYVCRSIFQYDFCFFRGRYSWTRSLFFGPVSSRCMVVYGGVWWCCISGGGMYVVVTPVRGVWCM